MTVHQICDNCGMEYDHAGVTAGGRIYCCAGCASGGPCTCAETVVVADDAMVLEPAPVVVAPGDDVVVVR